MSLAALLATIRLLEGGLMAVTIGLEFLPIIWALAIGQTSLLLLALLAGCVLLAKRGRPAAAGILLGIATVMSGVSIPLAVAHQLVGALLVVLLAQEQFPDVLLAQEQVLV